MCLGLGDRRTARDGCEVARHIADADQQRVIALHDLKEAYERATTEHRGMLTAGILDGYINEVMAEAMA